MNRNNAIDGVLPKSVKITENSLKNDLSAQRYKDFMEMNKTYTATDLQTSNVECMFYIQEVDNWFPVEGFELIL